MILIKNGCVCTMEEDLYEKGYIVIENEKIYDVGSMKDFSYDETRFDKVYDVNGLFVMPGIVDGHSHIGMWEDGLGIEGADGNEETDPITPHLSAVDAINPMDKSFGEGLAAGVTTSVIGPGSANVIGGSFCAVKMHGSCIDDMIIKSPVAMKVALGENPKMLYNSKNQSPSTRMSTAALLRETLSKAKEYLRLLTESESGDEDKPDYDAKMEALLPLIKKEIPMKVHAHRLDDIFTAIRIAKEFDLDFTIEHATEAHLAKEKMQGHKLLIGPIVGDRSKPELENMDEKAAGILEKAGIKPAIISDHPEMPSKYLMMGAAVAVKEGMSRMEALRAVTIYPAEYCGIADRVGSIKKGKDADIAIFDLHPLDYMSKAVYVFVGGKCVVER